MTNQAHDDDVVEAATYACLRLRQIGTVKDQRLAEALEAALASRSDTGGAGLVGEHTWEEALDSLGESVRRKEADGWEVELVRRRVKATLSTDRRDALEEGRRQGIEEAAKAVHERANEVLASVADSEREYLHDAEEQEYRALKDAQDRIYALADKEPQS